MTTNLENAAIPVAPPPRGTASAKKPRQRRKPKRAADVAFVARVVIDSDTLGVPGAARAHQVSERTVARFRKQRALGASPELAALIASAKADVHEEWAAQLKSAASKLLARVIELAATDASLHAVAGAFKLTSDAQLAQRMLALALGENDPEADGAAPVATRALRMLEGGKPSAR